MRVAIITHSFLESTYAIAHYMSKKDIIIDIYCVNYIQNKNIAVANFTSEILSEGHVDSDVIQKIHGDRLSKYLADIQINYYFFNGGRNNMLSTIIKTTKLGRNIESKKYDVYHIIQGSFVLYLISRQIPSSQLCLTLHESTTHESKMKFETKFLLKWIVKNKYPIIFHSEVTKIRYEKYIKNRFNSVKLNKSCIIPMGLFETYLLAQENNAFNPQDLFGNNFILFYGRFNQAKGIQILIDSYEELSKTRKMPSLVIAGSGNICFNKRNNEKIHVINKFLSNIEISMLNNYAKFIVCPYISASQSGIPLTTYLFNKPIIASNVGDFPNTVEQNKTGVLIEPNNRDQLMNAILKLLVDEKFYRMIISNIKIKYSSGPNSWDSIADKTINFYNMVHELSNK